MKLLKLLGFGLLTVAILSLLTSCGPASIIDEPTKDDAAIQVDVGKNTAAKDAKGKLAFSPALSNGVLVPTGPEVGALFLLASSAGIFAATRRKKL